MSSRGTGINTFPPEIWIDILSLLRNPVPPPLSAIPRWELRQPFLVSAIRLFRSLCTPLLYRTVVTDDFCGFLMHLQVPPARSLLALVENIFIEYQEERGIPSYYTLMRHGVPRSWELIDLRPEEERPQIIYNCEAEADTFKEMLSLATRMETRRVMPRLRTVAVASIYGNSGIWRDYEEWQRMDDGKSNIDDCVDLWDEFLATSNVEHCCMRLSNGPLGMNPISLQIRPELNRPLATIHFTGKTPTGTAEILCFRLGTRVRWMSDVPADQDWYTSYDIAIQSISRLASGRNKRFLKSKVDFMNLDIFCSTEVLDKSLVRRANVPKHVSTLGDIAATVPGGTAPRFTLPTQRAITEKVATATQANIRLSSKVKDVVRWRPSGDAFCEACGRT